jgi:hypothetical protein
MRLARSASHALLTLVTSVFDWRVGGLLVVFVLLLVAAAQAPLRYPIEIGRPDGPGSDQPLARGFHAADDGPNGPFRWSGDLSFVRLPGMGQRALIVRLSTLPITEEVARVGPQVIEIASSGQPLGTMPVRLLGSEAAWLVPPAPGGAGEHVIELRSTTFVPEGDTRRLGTPVGAMVVTPVGLALPRGPEVVRWLLAALVCWVALRHTGLSPNAAALGLALGIAAVALASALDPPRASLGAAPTLTAALLGLGLVVAVRGGLPTLFRALQVPPSARVICVLTVLALLVFGFRYGGKIYPGAMPGDIQFHINRFEELVRGTLFLDARNRGVSFPYPPALYLILAPFALLGIAPRALLQVGGAVADALSPVAVYLLAVSALGGWRPQRERAGLAAAAMYGASGAGVLATWWNFSTHIFTQFALLILLCALVLLWRQRAPLGWVSVGVLFVAQCIVSLGHFGFWINTALLGGVVVLLLIWRGGNIARPPLRSLTAAVLAAQLVCAALFYSAYADRFRQQFEALAAGTDAAAGSSAEAFAVYWQTLLYAGLHDHLGLFLAPLGLVGVALLMARTPRPARGVPDLPLALMVGTLAVVALFTLLPLVSGANLATRWLSFSAWVFAVGAAVGAQHVWRLRRAGRIALVTIAIYVVWVAARLWLEALAWRVRPPEPF